MTQARSRERGQRAGLRPATVIAAARRLLRRDGLGAVTMRRLADELGVAPNSLYSHVTNKAALLDAVLDDVIGGLDPPDAWSTEWRDGLTVLMGRTRRLLLDHAELIPLFLSRPTRGPNAIRLGELTLEFLACAGIDDKQAIRALQALVTYTVGFAALEAPWLAERQPDLRRLESQAAFAAAQDYPITARLAPLLARQPTDEDFTAGLRWLFAGIEQRT